VRWVVHPWVWFLGDRHYLVLYLSILSVFCVFDLLFFWPLFFCFWVFFFFVWFGLWSQFALLLGVFACIQVFLFLCSLNLVLCCFVDLFSLLLFFLRFGGFCPSFLSCSLAWGRFFYSFVVILVLSKLLVLPFFLSFILSL